MTDPWERFLLEEKPMDIPKRKLGRTGVDVSILGLGGEGILRTFGREREACELINRAVDLGINYFDCARAYSGSESYYGRTLKDRRSQVFLASKSHARDKDGAWAHLQETLRSMKTDHLDLWQIHDVRTEDDVARIFGVNGCIEAFRMAREKGLARFIGVTSHEDASLLRGCIELFDFDTVLVPVNPCDSVHGNFITELIPAAEEKGIGVIGMKVYFKGRAAKLPKHRTTEPFFRFALSHNIATAVVGCDSAAQLEENFRYAASFVEMTDAEAAELVSRVIPHAGSRLNYKPHPPPGGVWRLVRRLGGRALRSVLRR